MPRVSRVIPLNVWTRTMMTVLPCSIDDATARDVRRRSTSIAAQPAFSIRASLEDRTWVSVGMEIRVSVSIELGFLKSSVHLFVAIHLERGSAAPGTGEQQLLGWRASMRMHGTIHVEVGGLVTYSTSWSVHWDGISPYQPQPIAAISVPLQLLPPRR